MSIKEINDLASEYAKTRHEPYLQVLSSAVIKYIKKKTSPEIQLDKGKIQDTICKEINSQVAASNTTYSTIDLGSLIEKISNHQAQKLKDAKAAKTEMERIKRSGTRPGTEAAKTEMRRINRR